jgi:hypothetical protein
MSEILFHYRKVDPTTWVYLSSLLTICVYFKFNRFWSVRNLDLVLLILLAPGLLMVHEARQMAAGAVAAHGGKASVGQLRAVVPDGGKAALGNGVAASQATSGPAAGGATAGAPAAGRPPAPLAASTPGNGPGTGQGAGQRPGDPDRLAGPRAGEPGGAEGGPSPRELAYWGYAWLLAMALVWLVRMLLDTMMVRRPLLEPNLTTGGLIFLGCALFVFLMANVITSDPTPDDLKAAAGAEALLQRRDTLGEEDKPEQYQRYGPGYYFLHLLPSIPTHPFVRGEGGAPGRLYALVAKTMAISSHLAVVLGLVILGYWHFDNFKMGVGAATLYLMLPYTAQMTGHVDHVLPAALLLWAVVLYRRPVLAGLLLGLATSVVYYPLFLLPLWASFYAERGLGRFLSGVLVSVAIMVLSLALVSSDLTSFWLKVQQMFALWVPRTQGLHGIWALGWDPWFRLPVIAGCVTLAGSLALWPAHKNLGTLLSCSAAVMLAVQFWHAFGDGGGMYMAWYLPLVLATVFRPNLEDRVALSVLGEGWLLKRRTLLVHLGRAA